MFYTRKLYSSRAFTFKQNVNILLKPTLLLPLTTLSVVRYKNEVAYMGSPFIIHHHGERITAKKPWMVVSQIMDI